MDKIKKGPSMQPYLSSGALTFIVVSDFNKPDAFIEPAKGCDYIVHVASPLPTLVDEDLVEPALAATRAIIAAAEATPSVKRIVTTSSTSGIRLFGRELKDDPVNIAIATGKDEHIPPLTADTQVPTQPPLPAGAAPTERYNASKIAAINWLREYNATRKSATFSIINIMPGWVLGPEELTFSKADALQGSNYVLAWLFQDFSLAPLMGLPEGTDTPLLAETVHLDDVAEGHVKALNIEKVPGQFRNFLLSSNSPSGPVLMDAVNIVKRNLPKEVAEGKIPFTGRMGKSFQD